MTIDEYIDTRVFSRKVTQRKDSTHKPEDWKDTIEYLDSIAQQIVDDMRRHGVDC
jgi:hypothetical protein